MALTSSSMLPLGTPLPRFVLPDAVSGLQIDLGAPGARTGTLVAFICNHCPAVLHVLAPLVALLNSAVERRFAVFAINVNSLKTHPQDGPVHMKALALEKAFRFPFLFDESQDSARAFGAVCTPDFFLFDADGALVYRGQFDDTRPSSGQAANGADLRRALEQVEQGKPPLEVQKPSLGCSIKWKDSPGF